MNIFPSSALSLSFLFVALFARIRTSWKANRAKVPLPRDKQRRWIRTHRDGRINSSVILYAYLDLVEQLMRDLLRHARLTSLSRARVIREFIVAATLPSRDTSTRADGFIKKKLTSCLHSFIRRCWIRCRLRVSMRLGSLARCALHLCLTINYETWNDCSDPILWFSRKIGIFGSLDEAYRKERSLMRVESFLCAFVKRVYFPVETYVIRVKSAFSLSPRRCTRCPRRRCQRFLLSGSRALIILFTFQHAVAS